MIFTIVVFLLVLSLLVFVHELGHFLTARKFGVGASEFGFGFPPRVIGFYKDQNNKWKKVVGGKEVTDAKDTVYSINAIPLGGFVKIKGENGDDASDKDSFASRPIWQRFLILAAGVTMNVILAMALLSFGYMIGLPHSSENLPKSAIVTESNVQIMDVAKDSPAAKAGITAGDAILKVNGHDVKSETEVQSLITAAGTSQMMIGLQHLGQYKDIYVTPTWSKDYNKNIVGISMASASVVRYPWYLAFWYGSKDAIIYLWMIIVSFGALIASLFGGASMAGQVAGPIGIATITGQAARMGFSYLLQFAALLSLNLAVINFIPFPALDGGRALFLLFEKIKGRPVKRELETVMHNIGFALLMLLVLVVTFKDILKFFK
ncbi:MAG: RIP metalloprotease RseP [Candidatus Falkowbacteria bacterium]